MKLRPFLEEFLEFAAKRFELIVFCKGCELYCSPVLDAIEHNTKYFAHRVYGDHALFENPKFSVKYYDFLLTDGRSVDSTIIVDSNVGAYCLRLYNGLPIRPYLRPDDTELIHLAKYLEEVRGARSVPEIIGSCVRRVFSTSGTAVAKRRSSLKGL